MSILVPLCGKGITMSEVPNKIAVYLEIGECTQYCPGCHSSQLHKVDNSFTIPTRLECIVSYADRQLDKGANAIVIMGGTTNHMFSISDLKVMINRLSELAPVCLYSGSDDEALNKDIAETTNLTWIKTGSYKEGLGGLSSKTTNQRFYKKERRVKMDKYNILGGEDIFVDMTYLFQT